MKLLFNLFAISGSALFAGVLLAIGVLIGGYWKTLSATDFLTSFTDFLSLVPRAIGVVGLTTVVGLAGSIWLGYSEKEALTQWLFAAGCIGTLFLLTALWFGPVNSQFMAKSLPLDQVIPKRDQWLMLHTVRVALAVAASVLSFIASNR